jgi:ketosteroid isomerase-like protein
MRSAGGCCAIARLMERAMSTAENKRLVQQIFADSASRSGTTFIDHLADDVCWIITGQWSWSQTFQGRDAVVNKLGTYVRSLLNDRMRTVAYNFIAEGDTVVVEAKGDNVTKTGLRYDNDYCLIFRIENGRIKQIKEYNDSALVEKVLGPFPQHTA